jgi:hypothetical protein
MQNLKVTLGEQDFSVPDFRVDDFGEKKSTAVRSGECMGNGPEFTSKRHKNSALVQDRQKGACRKFC